MPTNRIPVDVNVMLDQPLFSELDEPRIREIARGGWIVRAKRGTRILGRGEILEGMYLVTEGNLKLYMLSCGGDERVLRVLQPGDSFGEVLMFNMLPSPVYVDTLAQASLAFFPRDVINAALTRDPDFTATMLRSMSAMMRNLIVDLETCCLQNAQQRTANYLLRAAREARHHTTRSDCRRQKQSWRVRSISPLRLFHASCTACRTKESSKSIDVSSPSVTCVHSKRSPTGPRWLL